MNIGGSEFDDLTARMGPALRAQFAQAYALTKESLTALGATPSCYITIMKGRLYAMDAAVEHFVRSGESTGARVACAEGCSSCCYQSVQITASDAFALATFSADSGSIPPRLTAVSQRVATMTDAERWAQGIPCPFLVNKRCSVYPVRPQPCRCHLSVSKGACLTAWAQRKRAPGEREGIPLLIDGQAIGSMLVMGSDSALMHHGIQAARGELAGMVARALMPDAFMAWLGGERVFDEAATGGYSAVLSHMVEQIPLREVNA